jgi:DNA-binding CsgD family transcriptional regulator
LTKRELQIFRLLGARFRTKRIAADLGLSIRTVEAHRESIRHKLGLRDARSLFDYAFAWAQSSQAMALPDNAPSDSQRLPAP